MFSLRFFFLFLSLFSINSHWILNKWFYFQLNVFTKFFCFRFYFTVNNFFFVREKFLFFCCCCKNSLNLFSLRNRTNPRGCSVVLQRKKTNCIFFLAWWLFSSERHNVEWQCFSVARIIYIFRRPVLTHTLIRGLHCIQNNTNKQNNWRLVFLGYNRSNCACGVWWQQQVRENFDRWYILRSCKCIRTLSNLINVQITCYTCNYATCGMEAQRIAPRGKCFQFRVTSAVATIEPKSRQKDNDKSSLILFTHGKSIETKWKSLAEHWTDEHTHTWSQHTVPVYAHVVTRTATKCWQVQFRLKWPRDNIH